MCFINVFYYDLLNYTIIIDPNIYCNNHAIIVFSIYNFAHYIATRILITRERTEIV
jgi:hypothetical protein